MKRTKTLLGLALATLTLATAPVHALTVSASVSGGASLFTGTNFLPSELLPNATGWSQASGPVYFGLYNGGDQLSLTASGAIDYDTNHSWGDNTSADGKTGGLYDTPAVWADYTAATGTTFRSGQLVGLWSRTVGTLDPIGNILALGTSATLTVPTSVTSAYLYLGVADEGWGDNGGAFNVTASVTPVPLPGTLWLFGSALLGLVGFRRFAGEASPAAAAA